MVGFILMKVSSCSTKVSVPNTMTTIAVTMAIIGTWRVTIQDATIATTTATMKAPVATNKLALALAKKKISSGPSSVASLNSGCGCFLFMSVPLFLVMRAGQALPDSQICHQRHRHPEVLAAFGEPRRMATSAVLAAILRDAAQERGSSG